MSEAEFYLYHKIFSRQGYMNALCWEHPWHEPGTSNHQGGAAIDFTIGTLKTTSCVTVNGICTPPSGARNRDLWVWLSNNSETFGIKQYNREYWHFSPAGN